MRAHRLDIGISLGLAVLTLIAFGGGLDGDYEFVWFDDYYYVRDNPNVQAGLTGQSVWWALTSRAAHNWHPLTWVSLQLDSEMYGMQPWGFHLTNLLLHVANTVLLFLVLRWMTRAVWPAGAVAAFFAVHPLHVESVAWVTERKDVLSTFFWMLTLLAYAWYVERPDLGRYLLVGLFLTLGLMSKPMVVTLPCVLLLLDYWPLRRWRAPPAVDSTDASGAPPPEPPMPQVSAGRLLLEKIPLFGLAAASCVLTIVAQGQLIENAQQALPFGVRLLNAMMSYVIYLRQTFWPSDLAVLYLHPRESLTLAEGLAAGLLLVAITMLALHWRQRRPYLLVGWLWYLGTLVPVIGLLHVGQQARADRYMYVPLIGIFIAISWSAAEWLGRQRIGRVALATATAALLGACTLVTWSQLVHWRNSTTLYDRILQVSGDDPRMHAIVVATCLEQHETDAAIIRARTFRRLYPDNWQSHHDLGTALAQKGSVNEAVDSLERAIVLRPEAADIHKEIAGILWSQGKIPAAFKHLAELARLQPHWVESQHYQGIIYHQEKKLDEAIRCFQEAVRLDPEGALHHVNLALALEDKGDTVASGEEYRRAFEINSNWPSYVDQLARTLATHPDPSRRNGNEAIRLARAACSISGRRYPPFLETLAAAYAEAGRFERAVATADEARRLAVEARETAFVVRLDDALRLYRKQQPFRDNELK